VCELKGSENNSNWTLPVSPYNEFFSLFHCIPCLLVLCFTHFPQKCGRWWGGGDLVADTSASWAVTTTAFGSLYKNWGSWSICGQWTQNLLSHDEEELQVRSSNGVVKFQNTFYRFITTTDELKNSSV